MDSETCWSLEGGGCREDEDVEGYCDTAAGGGAAPPPDSDAALEGNGCSTVGAGPLWLLVLMWSLRRLWPLLLLVCSPAWAADAQQVYPSTGAFIALDDPQMEPWSLSAAVSMQALNRPAVLRAGDQEQPVIGRMNTGALELQALLGPVELAAVVPVHVGVQGFGNASRVPGDVQVRMSLPLSDSARWGVTTHVPRGGAALLLGTPGAVGSELMVQNQRGMWTVHTQFGILLQQQEQLPSLVWGNRFTYGMGFGTEWRSWSASAELIGSAPLPLSGIPGAWPLEGLVSVGVPSGNLRLGVGKGLSRGFGSPQWRVAVVSSASTGEVQDSDLDGIVDPRDLCRHKREDADGYRDQDGCPDPDNDEDGYADVVDGCPDEAEVFNGLDDQDGCPDEIAVLRVRVTGDRGEPERITLKLDSQEQSLLGGEEAKLEVHPGEHALRVSAEGYRPVALRLDLGPGGTLVELVLEKLVFGELLVTVEGPERGTLHVEDGEFPIEGERLLALPAGSQLVRVEADGWAPAHAVVQVPEDGRAELTLRPNRLAVDLDGSQVVLAEEVHFELDSCEVIPGEGLQALAAWLKETPSVRLMRIEGHADEVGGPAYNYGLSMCRAEAVVAWLVEEGVDAERLVAVAAGEALADGPGSRRVSFLVLIWNEEVEVEEPFD